MSEQLNSCHVKCEMRSKGRGSQQVQFFSFFCADVWLNGTFSWAVDDGRIITQSLSRLRSVAGAHVWAVEQLSGDTILRLKEGQPEDYHTGCPTEFNETNSSNCVSQLCRDQHKISAVPNNFAVPSAIGHMNSSFFLTDQYLLCFDASRVNNWCIHLFQIFQVCLSRMKHVMCPSHTYTTCTQCAPVSLCQTVCKCIFPWLTDPVCTRSLHQWIRVGSSRADSEKRARTNTRTWTSISRLLANTAIKIYPFQIFLAISSKPRKIPGNTFLPHLWILDWSFGEGWFSTIAPKGIIGPLNVQLLVYATAPRFVTKFSPSRVKIFFTRIRLNPLSGKILYNDCLRLQELLQALMCFTEKFLFCTDTTGSIWWPSPAPRLRTGDCL